MASETFPVPLRRLTAATAGGIGVPIAALAEAEIEQVRWRPTGTRPLTSGGYGGVVDGPFDVYWEGEVMVSRNHAVDREDVLGWRIDPATARRDREPADRARLLVDEVNYHDDGGQAFIAPGVPTVFLAAPPGDDVAPEDFVALYSDGALGLSLHPGVWHTAPLPLATRATYQNKQGAIHATVALWARQEWGLLLDVPLREPS